jgi:hypothetical protein
VGSQARPRGSGRGFRRLGGPESERAGTALVGSHTEVADRIEEYAGLGVSEFILSGYPHLEEAYWFGEGVLPILRQRGRWQHPAPGSADDSVGTTPFAPTSGPAYPPPYHDAPGRAERAAVSHSRASSSS